MPARSDRAGPVNPKTTWNAVTTATAITNSAAARTAPGLTQRNACCNRPWRRSMATGTAMLTTCSSSSTRLAIALASIDAAQRNQHRGHRDSIECQRNGRRQCAPHHHRRGNRDQHEQRLVEQDRRVGRQPPQRHQRDEQRCGDRSAVGALRRAGVRPRSPVKSQPSAPGRRRTIRPVRSSRAT